MLYRNCLKRCFDFLLSLTALLLLSPLLLLLSCLVAVKMKGNPFFTQLRPGKDEKLFRLIKFRSMTNLRDEHGALLPDELRLTRFGRLLRASSLDELPELLNILKGDMALVGPRPLLIEYLPLYNDVQRHRHDVRPGLTGLAQVNGRNSQDWDERFAWDLKYVSEMNFRLDLHILLNTIKTVIRREGITSENSETMEKFKGSN